MNYIQVVAMGTELKIHYLLVMRVMDNCIEGIPTNDTTCFIEHLDIFWITRFIYLGLVAKVRKYDSKIFLFF